MNEYIQRHQVELKEAIDFFQKDIASIRTGRANPALFDLVLVESYGGKVPLQQVGNIAVVDARCMTITPWDKNTLKEIEKGIVGADLGLNPVNEGDKIRLVVPQLTEENRKELVKKLSEKMETARIALRQIRDEIKEAIEAAFKDKAISEDDKFRFIKELDEEITKQNDALKSIKDKREEEIMTI